MDTKYIPIISPRLKCHKTVIFGTLQYEHVLTTTATYNYKIYAEENLIALPPPPPPLGKLGLPLKKSEIEAAPKIQYFICSRSP